MAQAHLLKPAEHDPLVALHANLRLAVYVRTVEKDTACDLLALIDAAIAALERGGFLKGKELDLPWPTEPLDEDAGAKSGTP
jgi:hypothetical protein